MLVRCNGSQFVNIAWVVVIIRSIFYTAGFLEYIYRVFNKRCN